jgi:hypothetical protein
VNFCDVPYSAPTSIGSDDFSNPKVIDAINYAAPGHESIPLARVVSYPDRHNVVHHIRSSLDAPSSMQWLTTSAARRPQCLGCGTLAPAQMREEAASDKSVAAAISLSEKASSFAAISRLNPASPRWPGCSRAQLRLREGRRRDPTHTRRGGAASAAGRRLRRDPSARDPSSCTSRSSSRYRARSTNTYGRFSRFRPCRRR